MSPAELVPGDVVTIDGARFEITSKPFLGLSGASVFDTPRLFWRARVRSLEDDGSAPRYSTWGVGERVSLNARRAVGEALQGVAD